jgi:hypothetical protein
MVGLTFSTNGKEGEYIQGYVGNLEEKRLLKG